MGLSDAVNTPDSLLHLHGIPREVIVDYEIGGLEIDAFGSRIRTHQNIDFSAQKPVLDFVSFHAAHLVAAGLRVLPALAGIGAKPHGGMYLAKPAHDIRQGICIREYGPFFMDLAVLAGLKGQRPAGLPVNPEHHPDLQAAG